MVKGGRRDQNDELRRLYREHVGAVYAFFAYSVNRTVAEDLTSGTFERVIKAWRSYDARKASERTWILAIARNLLTDHYRRQSHRDAVSTDEHPELVDVLADVDGGIERVLTDDALRALLAPLGPREREVLALRYAAELPATEVAELTGLSSANVHQVASRALRRLRAELERSRLTDSA
jgi:RNA polymerase sigma-70 factor, ECF subfamily